MKGIINIESQRKELDKQLFYSELDDCDYSRSFYIPDDANIDKIKAKSSNGILNIEIPKLKELKKDIKKIAISLVFFENLCINKKGGNFYPFFLLKDL